MRSKSGWNKSNHNQHAHEKYLFDIFEFSIGKIMNNLEYMRMTDDNFNQWKVHKKFYPNPHNISTHHSWICYMVLRILYLKFATHKIPHIYVLYFPYTYTYTHIVEIFTDSSSYCIPKSKRARITGKWNWKMMKNTSLHFVYKKNGKYEKKRIHRIQTDGSQCMCCVYIFEWMNNNSMLNYAL